MIYSAISKELQKRRGYGDDNDDEFEFDISAIQKKKLDKVMNAIDAKDNLKWRHFFILNIPYWQKQTQGLTNYIRTKCFDKEFPRF